MTGKKKKTLCVEINGAEQTQHDTAPCPGGSNQDVPFTGTLAQVEAVIRRELRNGGFLVEMQDNKNYENWYELTVRVGVLVETRDDWGFVPPEEAKP